MRRVEERLLHPGRPGLRSPFSISLRHTFLKLLLPFLIDPALMESPALVEIQGAWFSWAFPNRFRAAPEVDLTALIR